MKKYLVEFLGTMFLVFVILTTGNYLAIGAALAIVIMLGGAISGSHVNPVVTLAFLTSGKMKMADVIPYIAVQIIGALAAVQLVKVLYKR